MGKCAHNLYQSTIDYMATCCLRNYLVLQLQSPGWEEKDAKVTQNEYGLRKSRWFSEILSNQRLHLSLNYSLPTSSGPQLKEVTSLATWCYCFLGYLAIITADPTTIDQLVYAWSFARLKSVSSGSSGTAPSANRQHWNRQGNTLACQRLPCWHKGTKGANSVPRNRLCQVVVHTIILPTTLQANSHMQPTDLRFIEIRTLARFEESVHFYTYAQLALALLSTWP